MTSSRNFFIFMMHLAPTSSDSQETTTLREIMTNYFTEGPKSQQTEVRGKFTVNLAKKILEKSGKDADLPFAKSESADVVRQLVMELFETIDGLEENLATGEKATEAELVRLLSDEERDRITESIRQKVQTAHKGLTSSTTDSM